MIRQKLSVVDRRSYWANQNNSIISLRELAVHLMPLMSCTSHVYSTKNDCPLYSTRRPLPIHSLFKRRVRRQFRKADRLLLFLTDVLLIFKSVTARASSLSAVHGTLNKEAKKRQHNLWIISFIVIQHSHIQNGRSHGLKSKSEFLHGFLW